MPPKGPKGQNAPPESRRDADVVSSEEYDRLRHAETGVALVRAMAAARGDLEIEHPKPRPPVRDVRL